MYAPSRHETRRAADEIELASHGLMINGTVAIRRAGDIYLPILASNPNHVQEFRTLNKICAFLNNGDTYSALIYAATAKWNHFEDQKRTLRKANFNPFELRDYRGRWARDAPNSATPKQDFIQIGYNGTLHDAVVDNLMNAFRKMGAIAEKNITVIGVPGIASIPDLIVLPVGAKLPIVIEIKTGANPPFTPNQEYVYPLLCIGGHVSSTDFRLPSLNLSDGSTFPPLEVHVLSTAGPGKPLYPLDLCKYLGLRP